MLLPLQGALSIDSYTQGVALGYVLMPLRGVSTHLTEEPFFCSVFMCARVLTHDANIVIFGLLKLSTQSAVLENLTSRKWRFLLSATIKNRIFRSKNLFSSAKS